MEELEQIVSSEDDRCWCVYIHRNKINNKAYIGIAKNIQKRWGVGGKNYLAQRADGSYEHPAFAKALKKYDDWDNYWEHIIFQKNLTQLDAKHIEVLLIALFKTNCSRYKKPEYGYNLTDGGEGVVGYEYTEEVKAKMRKPHPSAQGKNHPNYGKPLSDELKNKISIAVQKAMQDEDVLKKIRKPRPSMQGENNPRYGKSLSIEQKEKLRQANIGRIQSEEERRKRSVANSGENNPMYGKHHSEESREKMSGPRPSIQGENNPNYGRVYSEEEIMKIRQSHKKEMKCVVQLDVNGTFINKYESIRCANRETGINHQCISFCCQDKYEKAGGFIWIYEYIYNENINNIILYMKERKKKICQTRLALSAT